MERVQAWLQRSALEPEGTITSCCLYPIERQAQTSEIRIASGDSGRPARELWLLDQTMLPTRSPKSNFVIERRVAAFGGMPLRP